MVMDGGIYIDKFYTLDNGNIVNIHYESDKIDSITIMKDDPVVMDNINSIKSDIPHLSFQPKHMNMNGKTYRMVYDTHGIMISCKIDGEELCTYKTIFNSVISIHPLVFDNFYMEELGKEVMVYDEYEFDNNSDYEHFSRTILT